MDNTMNNTITKTTIYNMNTDTTIQTDASLTGRNGVPFFRKFGPPLAKNHAYSKEVESAIVKILMEHPHPNIVTYYEISDNYIDMEQLYTEKSSPSSFEVEPSSYEKLIEIQEVMSKVKDFLQALGIMYIDWKFDNLAKSVDGTYKLFDFDASGLIDLKTNDWILKPQPYWSYRKAIENSCITPKEIDDWSFNFNIIEEGKKLFKTV
jgi:hypothetical protein